MKIKILFEDKDIIVAVKPFGMPSQADKTGEPDITTLLSQKTEVHVINRLDRPVGGIMVFAKNQKSAAELSLQVQNRTLEKEYMAVVCGKPSNPQGEFIDFLIKNQKTNMSRVVNKDIKGSKEAKLSYHLIDEKEDSEFGTITLLKVKLFTGRHHQIRVQFASRSLPLWGDSKYNQAFSRRHGFNNIGLYSSFLSFKHPINKKLLVFEDMPSIGIFEKFI